MFESCWAHHYSLAISANWCLWILRAVNNREQFAADLVDGGPQRPVQNLRVHVQRRVDVGVPHQLSDDFPGHAFVV